MTQIATMMTDDHRACDARLVDLETHVANEDWQQAGTALAAFRNASLRHFAMEEGELFPAFEAATGSSQGPTAVMRSEHEQIRALLDQLQQATDACDGDRLLGLTESLMVLVQQHNMKEEQILYPMADQALPDVPELIARMRAVQAAEE